MISLVKTDRKPDLRGVTPAVVAGGTLFFVSLLALYFMGQHYDHQPTVCLFKAITKQPCFLCGGTRASINLATGHPVTAFKFNPLVTLILCYLAIWAILKFGFARRIALQGPLNSRQIHWVLAIVVVIANWIYIIKTL